MLSKKLDVARLDKDIDYRRQIISYLLEELAGMQEFHDQLSQQGNLIGEIMLNKISETKAKLQILWTNVYDGLI